MLYGYNYVYAQVIFPGIDDNEVDEEINENSGIAVSDDANYYNPSTNSITADSDIKDVVILSPSLKLINEGYLPDDVTIAQGTYVTWINGQNGTIQSLVVEDESQQEIFSNSSIPYLNGASYQFEEEGNFSFYSPANPSLRGSVNVVAGDELPDNPAGNSTMVTLGVFIAPSVEDEYWNKHLNSMAFKPIEILTSDSDSDVDKTMFVYLQKSGKPSTVMYKVGVKLALLESHLNSLSSIS